MKVKNMAKGPDMTRLYTYRELPIGSVIYGADSPVRKTGQWSYSQPVISEKLAPCQLGCPLGTPIRAMLERVKNKEYSEAMRLLKEENPFPGICGRVCFHPCETRCIRGEIDEPVNINALERFIADRAGPSGAMEIGGTNGLPGEVAVVGGGPAGLSCSYFLRRMGHQVTLYDDMPSLGGMLRYGIPPYRLPRGILDDEIKAVLDCGIKTVSGTRIGRDISWDVIRGYDAAFIALGNQKSLKAHLPGEEGEGVFSGVDFLQRAYRGVPISLGQRVAVIGGGNTAIDTARIASRLGSRPIILYRRDRKEMPAFKDEIEEARDEGIEIEFLTLPVRIILDRRRVKGIECIRTLLQAGVSGRSKVVPVEGSNFIVDADSVILAIGEEMDSECIPREWKIIDGKIFVDSGNATGEPGVFAGGDAVSSQKTVVNAIASGKSAAVCIDMFLRGKRSEDWIGSFRIGMNGPISMRAYLTQIQAPHASVGTGDINPAYCPEQKRAVMPKLLLNRRTSLAEEVNLGFDERLAYEAADRCLHCGGCRLCENCYIFCPEGVVERDAMEKRMLIDYDHCKGCGICRNECPVGAIDMEVEEEK